MGDEFGCFWGDSLYDYADKKEAIIEYILYRNDCICISSKPGTGKSLLAKQLICNLPQLPLRRRVVSLAVRL